MGRNLLTGLLLVFLVYPVNANPEVPMTKFNRLNQEKSPYLLQHANNPVDWYPWGDEAFQKARDENKPIFLSIGYSTCHWCHVMAHESFEEAETADILNEFFVSIKVDREERPDIDNIYMTAVMAMTGHGGWPLSVFLTPQQKPFYGGTYFPPEPRWGSPGFKQILLSVAQNWKDKRDQVLDSSDALTEAIRSRLTVVSKDDVGLDDKVLEASYQAFNRNFDARYGGFGEAPKFPMGHSLTFLLRYWKRSGEDKALAMSTKTLEEMANGGVYDQLGGGFHRYSTDGYWHVPHFEKMLYDQALLTRAYLEAYQATGNPRFAEVANDIFDYVLREMTSGDGAFYSAQDADSFDPEGGDEKQEGAFYVWRSKEVDELFAESAEVFRYRYGVEDDGNAMVDPHGEFKGKNILYRAHTLEETAEKFKLKPEEVQAKLDEARKVLLSERSKRPAPHLDDKVLTDWNGLMISSLAYAAKVLDDDRYRKAAKRAADFILERLTDGEGRLLHRYRDGSAGITAHLEDYAFFIDGLIELYEATQEVKYLQEAFRLNDVMIHLFWDDKDGGFYFTADDAEQLIFRQKEIYDGAIPSGNSVAVYNLIRLAKISPERKFEERAEELVNAFAGQIKRNPNAYSQFMIALDFILGPSNEIVIAGDPSKKETTDLFRAVSSLYVPRKVLLFRPADEAAAAELFELSSFTKAQIPIEGRSTAYVCRNRQCKLPVHTPQELQAQLLK